MPYSIPGINQRFNFRELNSNNDYVMKHAFEQIFHQSIQQNGHQLYTDNSTLKLFVGRPSYWMNVFDDEDTQLADAYTECLDIWSGLMDEHGKFTAAGLMVANCIVDQSDDKPTLESYIEARYGFDENRALAVTSRAMWDLFMIRGLPETSGQFGL